MERVYRIVADGSSAINALNKISDSANKLESGMGKVGSALSAATKAFAGFAAAKGLGGITSATEQIATLEASLSTLRGSAEAGADMLQRVFAIVGNTGADLDGVATSIQRLSIGMQDMGANNAQISAVAENFIKLGKVGGTSMADVNGALVQFGQALSSGVLQGDEFKSLSERMPLLMKGLAKEIGVSAGELKRMGSEGKITADVLANTLLKLGPELQADFAALPVTFEQGMNKLKLTTTLFLAELGKTSGIMDTVSASLDYINEGLKNVGSSTSAIGAIGGVLKVAFQAVAVVASDLAFIIGGIASDIVRLGKVAASLATGDFANIPKIWAATASEQEKSRKELDAFQARIMGLAPAMKEVAKAGESVGTIKAGPSAAALKKMADEAKKAADELKKIKEAAADREIDAITRQFDDMAKATKAAADEVTRLREAAMDRELDAIANSFEKLKGTNPLTTITEELNALGQRVRDLDALREKIDDLYFSGKITGEEFAHLGQKFGLVFSPDAPAVKNINEMQLAMKNLAVQGVGQLVDTIFDAGKSFKDFAADFLKQIAKMIVKQQVLNALKGSSFGSLLGFAKGGAFASSTGLPWGIYDKPTYFNMPGSGPLKKFARGGVLGEGSSPEAILPLSRNAQGVLGLKGGGTNVSVNVNNYSANEVSVTETRGADGQISIDVEIKKSMTRAFGDGSMDRVMKSAFGLSRQAA